MKQKDGHVHFPVTMRKELAYWVRVEAAKANKSRSAFIRDVLEAAFQKIKPKQEQQEVMQLCL